MRRRLLPITTAGSPEEASEVRFEMLRRETEAARRDKAALEMALLQSSAKITNLQWKACKSRLRQAAAAATEFALVGGHSAKAEGPRHAAKGVAGRRRYVGCLCTVQRRQIFLLSGRGLPYRDGLGLARSKGQAEGMCDLHRSRRRKRLRQPRACLQTPAWPGGSERRAASGVAVLGRSAGP